MTKRSGVGATHVENHADLFGGAPPPPPLPKKKSGAARRFPFAKATQTPAEARAIPSAKTTGADALLNVRQAAARLGLSKSTLDKMRIAGKGPRFIKSTDRAIRYDSADLDRWINERRSKSD
jgi:predicted DNA-binding transcriptional regulator AlpA